MNAIEFTTELSENPISVPKDVAAKLPKSGRVRVIIMTEDDSSDAEWKSMAYGQFLREDPPEDSVYDSLK